MWNPIVLGLVVSAAIVAVGTQADSNAAPSPNQLYVSDSKSRADSRLLQGAELVGTAYVFIPGNAAVKRVRFYIDDPSRLGRPDRVATSAPFDLGGRVGKVPRPINIGNLTGGEHTVTAAIEYRSGDLHTTTATFVARRLYLSPAGSDAAACSRSTPCLTFGRALAVARSEDIVEVAGGHYGCETLSGSKEVTFKAAVDTRPWIACSNTIGTPGGGGMSLYLKGASNLTFENIWVAGLETSDSPNITLRNVHITCVDDPTHFALWGGHCSAALESTSPHFAMIGGEVGPTWEGDGSHGASRLYGDDSLIDGVLFHENKRGGGEHTECLMVRGGDGVTIRNSRFPKCNVFSLFFTCWVCAGIGDGPPAPKNVVVENNYFGPGPQFFAVQIADYSPTADNYDFRYNTSYKPFSIGSPGVNGSTMIGNIVAYGGCPEGFLIKHNVWGDDQRRTCGDRTNVSVNSSAGTSDGAGYDSTGHLLPGSPARGRGDETNAPGIDIDRDPRTVGPVDAGADQLFSTSSKPPILDPTKLFVSPLVTRRAARPLRGAHLRGKVFVFLPGNSEMKRVRFYLDDPKQRRRPVLIAASAPFDLGGRVGADKPLPIDVTRLTPGKHNVTAMIEYRTGNERRSAASFLAQRPSAATAR